MKSFLESYLNQQDKKKEYSNMIVVSEDNRILILRRANYMKKFKGLWGFVGGSIDDKDKSPKDAAIRELKEETGLELTFNEERNCKEFAKKKNQDNSISYYFLVKLETSPIDNIKISREHSKYDWYDYENQKHYNWMPDVFQLIQKYYED